MAELRNLVIKTGTLKRLGKEFILYIDEEKRERERVEKMKAEQADPYDIKHAENVLAESMAMVPDTKQRLKAAVKDMQEFMEDNASLLGETAEYKTAEEEAAKCTALLA